MLGTLRASLDNRIDSNGMKNEMVLDEVHDMQNFVRFKGI